MPAILGWNEPRRYLVLTQDPAEVRPTGGFIGSYGIVVFDRGSLADYGFHDVPQLDYPWDYPRIEPPQELVDYLLGASSPGSSPTRTGRRISRRLPRIASPL